MKKGQQVSPLRSRNWGSADNVASQLVLSPRDRPLQLRTRVPVFLVRGRIRPKERVRAETPYYYFFLAFSSFSLVGL